MKFIIGLIDGSTSGKYFDIFTIHGLNLVVFFQGVNQFIQDMAVNLEYTFSQMVQFLYVFLVIFTGAGPSFAQGVVSCPEHWKVANSVSPYPEMTAATLLTTGVVGGFAFSKESGELFELHLIGSLAWLTTGYLNYSIQKRCLRSYFVPPVEIPLERFDKSIYYKRYQSLRKSFIYSYVFTGFWMLATYLKTDDDEVKTLSLLSFGSPFLWDLFRRKLKNNKRYSPYSDQWKLHLKPQMSRNNIQGYLLNLSLNF